MKREDFIREYIRINTEDAILEIQHAHEVGKLLSSVFPEEISEDVANTYLINKENTAIYGRLRTPSVTVGMMLATLSKKG